MAVIDQVAGISGKKIEAAKLAQTKRLGQSGASGKQKRCKKGKSCGASCINSGKVCLVDIPWVTGSQIKKVATAIQSRGKGGKKPLTVSEVKAKLVEHHGKLKQATIAEDGKEYTKHRKELKKYLKQLKDMGEKDTDVPLPTWNKIAPIIKEAKYAEAKGDKDGKDKAIQKLKDAFLGKKAPPPAKDTDGSTGTKVAKKTKETPPLSPLRTPEDFQNKLSSTYEITQNPKLVEDSKEVAKILGKTSTSHPGTLYETGEFDKYDALKDKIGRSVLADGSMAMSAFTSSFDTSFKMRQADRGESVQDSYKKMADDLNRLLSVKELPRTEVEKFRGFRASPDRLNEMIESAKLGESFTLPSVNSWSSSLKTGRRFANRQVADALDRTERVIFRTINKRGVPIEFVTTVSGENEILTPKGTRYRYTGYSKITTPNGNTYHVLDMEELPS